MSYTNVSVNISENQKYYLKRAIESKSPMSIRLGFEDLCGNDICFDQCTSEQNGKSLREWKRHHNKNEQTSGCSQHEK